MKDLIIIGSGPAGLTAAIYARRANLDVLVIEAEVYGGKLSKTYMIENYPGFEAIGGGELADTFYKQALNLGTEIITGKVKEVLYKDVKKVILENGKEYEAKAIIVASGTKEKKLDVERSEEFTGNGISYCAVCDGFFYRKKDIVIVGGGNSALEEALYMSNLVNKIYIVIRRDIFRADKKVVDKVLANEKIEVIYNSLIESLRIEDDRITGVNIRNVNTNKKKTVDCAGIFPYVGAYPETDFLDNSLLDEKGYLIVDGFMKTKAEGLYGAGDVTNKDLRQVVTATNDGAIAANSVIKYLQNKQ